MLHLILVFRSKEYLKVELLKLLWPCLLVQVLNLLVELEKNENIDNTVQKVANFFTYHHILGFLYYYNHIRFLFYSIEGIDFSL